MASINLPFLQVPVQSLGKLIAWPIRLAAGTPKIEQRLDRVEERLDRLEQRFDTLVQLVLILVAKIAPDWTTDELGRILPQVASLGPVEQTITGLQPMGNPFTAAEIGRLQEYVHRARQPTFEYTPEEARDLRELAERLIEEHTGEPWVKDLDFLGLFIFAVFALAPAIKGE